MTRIAILWLTLGCASAAAQDLKGLPHHVTFLGPASAVSIARGRATPVTLQFRVASGFHINSNKPTSELLVPTVLTLNPPTDIVIGKITYPPGVDATFAFAPAETLNVYEGKFAIKALVTAAKTAIAGKYTVHASLKYQACDNRACYPPKSVPADFDIAVPKSKSSGAGVVRRGQSPNIHR
ncbi:MAG TPA: protein-disulfide reductase DsbD domain-containing protein [Terriglobales bacterium]|nr:protein-disulfide reductase DsbD domain-containing protein [Terriglobales bacterium]